MSSEFKALVVYFSRSGHTRTLAQAIAMKLGADLSEIKSRVDYGSGLRGYPRALGHALLKRHPGLMPLGRNLRSYDLILIGGPVWGGTLSPPIRTFLAENQKNFRKTAFFLTQGGTYGREKVLLEMSQLSKTTPEATLVLSEKDLLGKTFLASVSEFGVKLITSLAKTPVTSPRTKSASPEARL